jgi:hypothetical protein
MASPLWNPETPDNLSVAAPVLDQLAPAAQSSLSDEPIQLKPRGTLFQAVLFLVLRRREAMFWTRVIDVQARPMANYV